MRTTTRTTRRSTTVLTTLAGAAALVVGLAGPAAAEREAQTDPVGDTAVAVPTRAPSPTVKTTDITRISTRHSQNAVTIAVDVVRLRATDWGFTFRYRTQGSSYAGYVTNDGGDQYANFFGILGRSEPGEPCSPLVGVDRDRDRVTFAVPRSCFGNPSWVRTGAESSVPDGERFRGDDARQRGGRPGGTNDITLGPRVDGPQPL